MGSDRVFEALRERVVAAAGKTWPCAASGAWGCARPGRWSTCPSRACSSNGPGRRPWGAMDVLLASLAGRQAGRAGGRHRPVLFPPGKGRAGALRQGRPRAPRRLLRRRGLRSAGQGRDTMTPDEVIGRGGPQRLARAGRGGLPHRAQMEHGGQGRRSRRQVRRVQRRRGRPGGLHGPQCPGELSPAGAGRHGHRRLRGRRHAKATCTSGPSTPWR